MHSPPKQLQNCMSRTHVLLDSATGFCQKNSYSPQASVTFFVIFAPDLHTNVRDLKSPHAVNANINAYFHTLRTKTRARKKRPAVDVLFLGHPVAPCLDQIFSNQVQSH